jgi:hypothetical protein
MAFFASIVSCLRTAGVSWFGCAAGDEAEADSPAAAGRARLPGHTVIQVRRCICFANHIAKSMSPIYAVKVCR